jgi:hypothetical protein
MFFLRSMAMNWRFTKFRTSILVACYSLACCVQSDYTRLVKAELAKGVRCDSVLLGIKLGDSLTEFRDKCFALNKEHITTEGPGYFVQYFFSDSSSKDKSPTIRLLFQPGYDKANRISDIEMKFSYMGWAPWNRQYYSDSLKLRLIKMLERWYRGNKFVIAHVRKEDIPVKVDGNRRILVFEEVPQTVVVRVEDMLHPKYIDTTK